eukprot:CAMPEP_0201513806 /NCGR_PEP_ID=MMETSP0161_2-20130828/5787_1 /ASSEMBLY_ACC=CAM_ASM_000251 /TAXON_ID=180227 /ORGANISM="Neoparamoeba aestuarina, Strain SoJaBio B1-5/56/2" /LENGTH=421 /DNA_ID=CAMNT_0047910159 /DNA_START=73 /DNA_END=1335 /DNA_ORIENTATION=+
MVSNAKTISELGELLWNGEGNREPSSPVSFAATLINSSEEFCGGDVLFVHSMANALAVDCGEGGVVMIDTGSIIFSGNVYDNVKQWRDSKGKGKVQNVVFTHHHVDHVFGVDHYENEGPVKVYAHSNLPGHFDRYDYTNGYNAHINQRQFQLGAAMFPSGFRFPDVLYDESLTLKVGNKTFELHHGKGETDDATWVFIPEKKILATGDMFIWCCPNCGNPAKVQRYCKEWAVAMRQMMKLNPEYLFPGHGPPIWGADRVQRALRETAELLESIEEQAVALMNEGKSLAEVVAGVKVPPEVLARPYLRAVYDEPEFIVRNIWRRYGGWFDSYPPNLQPPHPPAIAKEVSSVAGGPVKLANKATSLIGDKSNPQNLRMARCFAEWAVLALNDATSKKDEAFVHEVRRKVYELSKDTEMGLMSR